MYRKGVIDNTNSIVIIERYYSKLLFLLSGSLYTVSPFRIFYIWSYMTYFQRKPFLFYWQQDRSARFPVHVSQLDDGTVYELARYSKIHRR